MTWDGCLGAARWCDGGSDDCACMHILDHRMIYALEFLWCTAALALIEAFFQHVCVCVCVCVWRRRRGKKPINGCSEPQFYPAAIHISGRNSAHEIIGEGVLRLHSFPCVVRDYKVDNR
jgi:hypothetical protein